MKTQDFIDLGMSVSLDNDYQINLALIEKKNYSDEVKGKILNFLKNEGIHFSTVTSLKECEICEDVAGSFAYFKNDKWIWANWLIHFVDKHNIHLPQDFISFIEKNV